MLKMRNGKERKDDYIEEPRKKNCKKVRRGYTEKKVRFYFFSGRQLQVSSAYYGTLINKLQYSHPPTI